jgi:hypothetical protein
VIFAVGADAGTKMIESIPTLAQIPASALPAFPDEAVVMNARAKLLRFHHR